LLSNKTVSHSQLQVEGLHLSWACPVFHSCQPNHHGRFDSALTQSKQSISIDSHSGGPPGTIAIHSWDWHALTRLQPVLVTALSRHLFHVACTVGSSDSHGLSIHIVPVVPVAFATPRSILVVPVVRCNYHGLILLVYFSPSRKPSMFWTLVVGSFAALATMCLPLFIVS
jgi:hypothetical protein